MHPIALLALAFILAGAVVCALRPAWAAPYFSAVIYAHMPDALRAEYGLPSLFMILAPALVVLALVRHTLFAEAFGSGWRSALWWLTAWGVVSAASFLYAIDSTRTAAGLLDHLDAVFIVLILTLFLRRRDQLAPVVWALIGAGLFLASLTLHQRLTGNFGSTYGGFARVELRNLLGETHGLRSAGPLSTNYFALILVSLVPLAADRLLHARALAARAVAGMALVAIVAAVACTYSRGGLLALGAVAFLMLLSAPKWPRILIAAAPVALVALWLAPAGYLERMGSFAQAWEGLRGRHVDDSAIRGRLSEFRSAAQMFGDHPLLGVGSGNYEVHYTKYAQAIALDGRREERQAHSLYLEVAAENGLVGLGVFCGLLGFAGVGVRRARDAFRASGDTDLAHLSTGIGIAFAGYLLGSVFLHLSYPRFFWVLVGIALAVRALAPPAPVAAPALGHREVWA